jgi:hypothetical protein
MQRYAIVFTPRAERQPANLYAFVAERRWEILAENFVGEILPTASRWRSFRSAA